MQGKGDKCNMTETNYSSSLAMIGKPKGMGGRGRKSNSSVTEQRAKAQRAKLDAQAEARQMQKEQEVTARTTPSKKVARQELQAKRRTIEALIESYIQDHIGGNHSNKTIEWHRTALSLLQHFLKEELDITHIDQVESDDISAWFAHMRMSPGANGKVRCERTIYT